MTWDIPSIEGTAIPEHCNGMQGRLKILMILLLIYRADSAGIGPSRNILLEYRSSGADISPTYSRVNTD
jgi:hypothetical protein